MNTNHDSIFENDEFEIDKFIRFYKWIAVCRFLVICIYLSILIRTLFSSLIHESIEGNNVPELVGIGFGFLLVTLLFFIIIRYNFIQGIQEFKQTLAISVKRKYRLLTIIFNLFFSILFLNNLRFFSAENYTYLFIMGFVYVVFAVCIYMDIVYLLKNRIQK